ncbi:MAG: hypothetical protein NWF14_08450 [Candidatus Bathyarchaeota archaeon]|nr:hypothetical protein [Candidatus Bathyarchaeota archaeon]
MLKGAKSSKKCAKEPVNAVEKKKAENPKNNLSQPTVDSSPGDLVDKG